MTTSRRLPFLAALCVVAHAATLVACNKNGGVSLPAALSTELTREQALPLLVAALPARQAQLQSREYACKASPSVFYASTGLGDGRDGEAFKPLHQSRWDGAILGQMEAMRAAGILGEITVTTGCMFPPTSNCRRTYQAPNLAMQYNPQSNNGYRGDRAQYTCVLPYADLGAPEITGVSNPTPTSAVVTWRRPWVVNERARQLAQTLGLPARPGLLFCPGNFCPSPGQEMTGETRFTRFDNGWTVAR